MLAGLVPLFPPEAIELMARSGLLALSGPGALDDSLAAAGLALRNSFGVVVATATPS